MNLNHLVGITATLVLLGLVSAPSASATGAQIDLGPGCYLFLRTITGGAEGGAACNGEDRSIGCSANGLVVTCPHDLEND